MTSPPPPPASGGCADPDATDALPTSLPGVTALAGEADAAWPEDATHDQLVGDWRLWQRRGGHRTSTDDQLTAWLATRLVRDQQRTVSRYLDIGTGVGSVLLLTSHALRPALSVGVEAQAQSVLMARRTVSALVDAPPLHILHGDLRQATTEQLGTFDLITGSPPYMPENAGVLPADAQRRACRFELRGGVEGYAIAAARLLRADGIFVLVFQSTWTQRVHDAGTNAGLSLVAQADIEARAGRGAFLSVYAFAWAPAPLVSFQFAVRDDAGEITPAYADARALLGLG